MSSIVLGGGIAGLSTAYYLSRSAGNKVILIEATSRLGGWIKSIKNANGAVYEAGPRTLRLVGEPGANTLKLIEELNLEKEVCPVLKSAPAAKNRMLYVDKKLHSLPNSLASLFKIVPPFKRPLVTALFKDLTTPMTKLQDDSIHNFVSRRLGPEIADYAVGALVCGVCAGDAKKISVNLLMGQLFDWEQQRGGIMKGMIGSMFAKKEKMVGDVLKKGDTKGELWKRSQKEDWSVWSLRGGLERLPQRLGEVLKERNVDLIMNSSCERLNFNQDGVEGNFGKTERAAKINIYGALKEDRRRFL